VLSVPARANARKTAYYPNSWVLHFCMFTLHILPLACDTAQADQADDIKEKLSARRRTPDRRRERRTSLTL